VFQFGTQAPVAVCKHEDKVYVRQTKQELAQASESKKTQKRSFAEANSERRDLLVEATTLLEKPDTHIKITGPKLLAALRASCENMRQSVVLARRVGSRHAHRNSRRKYAQAKKLQQQVASRIASHMATEEAKMVNVLHNPERETREVLPSRWIHHLAVNQLQVRDAIVQEFLSHRLGKRPCFSNLNALSENRRAPCLHIGANTGPANTRNQFAVLPNEVPAPCPDELQQQLQRLQAQMSGLERQLQGRDTTGSSYSEGRFRPHLAGRRPQQDRRTWAPQQQRPFVPSYRPRLVPPPAARWNHWPRRQEFPHPRRQPMTPQWRVREPPREVVPLNHGAPSAAPQNRTQVPPMQHRPAPAPLLQHPTQPPLSNPIMRPRVPYIFNENQRRRERRRRSRQAMYQELQDIVLRYVQVRVRADGRIYSDNERVTVRVAPALEQNARYNFLVERLAPRPRQVEPTDPSPLPNGFVDGQRVPQASPAIIEQTEGKENAATTEEKGSTSKPAILSSASDLPNVQVEQNVSSSINCETTSEEAKMNSSSKDVVMCGTTEMFGDGESDSDWEPPLVTQELTYFSEDEIVPNPKACFIPRTAMQQEGNKQGEVTVVPCFPVSGKNRPARFTPYDRPKTYRSISSQLPSDQDKLQTMATRPGADTRLKVSARQQVHEGANDLTEDGHCSTCSESSNSLEARSCSPKYETLAHSLMSGDEGEIAGHNVAPVHVANEDGRIHGGAVPSTSLGMPPQAPSMPPQAPSILSIPEIVGTSNHNTHVPPQQSSSQSESESRLARQVNELSGRMDQLFAMMMNFVPGGAAGQIQNIDPQIAEIEAAARQHNPSLIEVKTGPNPVMSFAPHPIMNAPASSSTTAPRAEPFRDYQDIEEFINR